MQTICKIYRLRVRLHSYRSLPVHVNPTITCTYTHIPSTSRLVLVWPQCSLCLPARFGPSRVIYLFCVGTLH